MAPFPNHFAHLIALLPTVDRMLSCSSALLQLHLGGLQRVLRPQAAREILQYLGDVIVECGARQARRSRELGILAQRATPILEQLLTPALEMRSELVQLLL